MCPGLPHQIDPFDPHFVAVASRIAAPGCRSPPSRESTSPRRRSAKRWATASPRPEIADSGLPHRASAATPAAVPRPQAATCPTTTTTAAALPVASGEAAAAVAVTVVTAVAAAKMRGTRCGEKERLVKDGAGTNSRRCRHQGGTGSKLSCRRRRWWRKTGVW